MPPSTPERLLPNKRLRHLLLAAQDVLGHNGLNATLKLAGLQRFANIPLPDNQALEVCVSDYAALIQATESQFGSGARGQFIRIGQAAFRQLTISDKPTWWLLALANRFLPPRQRLQRAMKQLAAYLAKPDGKVEVYPDDRRLLFVDETSPNTFGRNRASEMCWLTVGQLQECAIWATGDAYEVVEVACKAKGDPACKFEIMPA